MKWAALTLCLCLGMCATTTVNPDAFGMPTATVMGWTF